MNELINQLADRAALLEDDPTAWPAEQFDLLADNDVLRWVIPREYGGTECTRRELNDGYRRLAEGCLVTTFVLTQRNGACQRMASSENSALKQQLLPALAAGELFATVGISHLTTSRRHWTRPTVLAEEVGAGFRLAGVIPWVTGAAHADWIVTGATFEDGQQILVALETQLPGVSVTPAEQLLALTASQTSMVNVDVEVPRDCLLFGPMENVMQAGAGGGTGSVTTSVLGLGLAAAAIEKMNSEAERRPELQDFIAPLEEDLASIEADVSSSLEADDTDPALIESIRLRSNSLALRSTQAYLGASKGAGFVKGHPAERFARLAMFFLVWSCPQPVLHGNLRELTCGLVDRSENP